MGWGMLFLPCIVRGRLPPRGGHRKWEVGQGPRNLHSWDPLPSSDPNYLQMAWRQGWASAQMGTLRLQADSEFLATGRPCHDGLWLLSSL